VAVYFIRAGENGPVKIGHGNVPEQRLDAMQTGNHEILRIIRLMPGSMRIEALVHARFAPLKIRGEWYQYSDEMLTFSLDPKKVDVPLHPIKARIVQMGMTAFELSVATSVSKSAISKILRGGRTPSPHLCKRISAVTGIPLHELRPDIFTA
jgi:hypothetical protein